MDQERLLTVSQAANRLQVHEETVRRWLRTGILRGHLLTRRAGYRIRESDLDRFVFGDQAPSKRAA